MYIKSIHIKCITMERHTVSLWQLSCFSVYCEKTQII